MQATYDMKKPFDFSISRETISPSDYLMLIEAVGWSRFVRKESIPAALKNTLFSVVARHQDKVIGAGRIVGDGAIFFYIQDVMVLKKHRKKGVGRAIMNELCQYLETETPSRSYVGLFTHPTKSGFYEKWGFSGPKVSLVGMYKGTKKKPNKAVADLER